MTAVSQQASQDASSSAASATTSAPATAAEPTSSALTHRPRTQSEFDKLQLERYLHSEFIHTAALNDALYKSNKLLQEKNHTAHKYKNYRDPRKNPEATPRNFWGPGWNGYANGYTDDPPKVQGGPPVTETKILYPDIKRLRTPHRSQLRIKRKDMMIQAEQREELVPIRLEVDLDDIKLRDTLTWNLHDRVIPPPLFFNQLVRDLGLSSPIAEGVSKQLQSQFKDQMEDFFPHVQTAEEPLDPELPYSAYKNDEMRVLIKLNITIGLFALEDKFEWDMNNPLNSPEEFARVMAKDLSLPGEFVTAIAHCIREQTHLFARSLFGHGHPFDGRPVEDADLLASFLPSPITSVLRPQQQAKEFEPYAYEMNETELERRELIFSREQRRQKRSVNRRGGIVLPDLKDRPRTVRTLVVSSVIPGAARTQEESRLHKRVAGASGRGRRGAVRQDGALDLSESSDGEDSAPDSPAVHANAGTARTRGMRGAASAAQQRMANIGRSETPEALIAHHHETRISSRRFGRDAREDSVDNTSYIVKLKVPKEKFRKLVRELNSGRPSHQQTPSITRAQSTFSTPAPRGSMGPPSTPAPVTTSASGGQIGRVDAPPPVPGQPQPSAPPPPAWLAAGLTNLSKQYPNDRFEGMMRYSAVSMTTELPVAAPPPGPTPEGIKWMFLPRIRCHDCPGKLYTPGPDTTVGNFEVHLKNKGHREKVNVRMSTTANAGASGS